MDIIPNLLLALRNADSIVVLTGSGISAESGVPTFREAQTGLWAKYDPRELATPQAFQRNPELVWNWYQWRKDLITKASPNNGHRALVELERQTAQFSLITQNVDNLHRLAGSRNVLELHGNIFRTICFTNNHNVNSWPEDSVKPPICPYCGSKLRPDVVWFGESLPEKTFARAVEVTLASAVFISIGTSTLIEPAASLPYMARDAGALLIEINTNETPFSSSADHQLLGPAGIILPILVENSFNRNDF